MLLLTRECLDRTGRGRAAGVSNNGVAESHCVGHINQYIKENVSTRSRPAYRSREVPLVQSHACRCKRAPVTCNLLAALKGYPARRGLRIVGRLAAHVSSARGASRLVARRPWRGGKARSVLHARVRPGWRRASGAIFQRTARASGRGRTWRTGENRVESDPVEASFRES